jgi:hypothetical protein
LPFDGGAKSVKVTLVGRSSSNSKQGTMKATIGTIEYLGGVLTTEVYSIFVLKAAGRKHDA